MSSNFTRTVLVTGGTNGLGYQCATIIARQHPEYQVVIASRSNPNDSAAAINKATGHSNTTFLPLDLSDLAKVRSFASAFAAQNYPPVAALVFNAALQFPGDVEYTNDGIEKTFGISHAGHALLFSLLRPHLAEDKARIVVVSSNTHDPAKKSGMPDATYTSAEEMAHPTKESSKSTGQQRYTSVKLSNMLYTYALESRLSAVRESHKDAPRGKQHQWTVTALDPGLMPGTGLGRDYSPVLRFMWNNVLPRILPVLRFLLYANIHTPEESGMALARLAVGSDVEGKSGAYFEGLKEIRSSDVTYDKSKQEDIWGWSREALSKTEEEKRAFDLQDLL